MQVVLVMFRNDGERRSFSVVRNMTVIGRREDCDLRIPVGDVSRKHCRLVRTDDGIRIEDLGSSNGTYVNSERIQESELNAGDVVGVGPVQFIVQIDGEPDEEDMTPPIAQIPEPVPGAEPHDEMRTEQHSLEEVPAEAAEESALEEIPAEEEFQIEEEEPVAAAEIPLEEEPLDLEPAAEPAAAPAAEDDLEFELEEEPLSHEPAAAEPLHELDEFELETPAAGHEPAAADPEAELEFDELELDEEHPAEAPAAAAGHAPAESVDTLDELEFEDSELELDEAAPAVEAHAAETATEKAHLDLPPAPPAPPAYAEVDIESADELELEEPHAANSTPAESVSDSSWDLVIEETEAAHSHHDFKVDLDSPHEQPHGQA